MLVTQTQDHVSHVVIGGGSTIDFGVSNSAEFFNILSSTLYKDQALAVVREVLCNAWDAHIHSGKQDTPIEITIKENTMKVKDFGTGIHHDDIGPIYGTYGNSTKKNDGTQTGGFGLGCKAPFAYTDRFEVISCHDGVRTIYAMTKSSAQVGGKPGITTIAQLPTTDSGLSVTINLKPSDQTKFLALCRTIVSNGGMNATINGEVIEKNYYDQHPGPKSHWWVGRMNSPHRFQVRYGNVIYPIDVHHSDMRTIVDEAEKSVTKQLRLDHFNIMFQAEPNSISVTPSRESLSMQEHTVKTLKGLFRKFIDEIKEPIKPLLLAKIKEINDPEVIKGGARAFNGADFLLEDYLKGNNHAVTLDELAATSVTTNYPGGDIHYQVLQQRALQLADLGFIPKGLAHSFAKVVQKNGAYIPAEWAARELLAPLAKKMIGAGLNFEKVKVPGHRYASSFLPVKDNIEIFFKTKHLFPYLQRVLILSTSTNNLRDRGMRVSGTNSFFFYKLSLKKGTREAEQKFFESCGMNVYNLTELEEKKERAPAKTRKKGLVALSNAIYGSAGTSASLVRLEGTKPEKRIEKPEYFAFMKYDRLSGLYMSSDNLFCFAKLFGDEVGVCFTAPSNEVWRKKAKPITDLFPVIVDFCKNSAAIKKHLTYSQGAIAEFLDNGFKEGRKDNALRFIINTIQYKDERTPEEKQYTSLLYLLKNTNIVDPVVKKDVEDMFTEKPPADIAKLMDDLSKSKSISALDPLAFKMLLDNPATKAVAEKLMKFVLEN